MLSCRRAASAGRWSSAYRSICRPGRGRESRSCRGLRRSSCRALRRCRRIPMTWRGPPSSLPAPSASWCSPGWARSKPARAPLAALWLRKPADCCRRRFRRAGCSATIRTASASRAASRPRWASSIWRKRTSSSRWAARSPTTRAAAASYGRRRRCCRSTSTRSRSARARKWRSTICAATLVSASRPWRRNCRPATRAGAPRPWRRASATPSPTA